MTLKIVVLDGYTTTPLQPGQRPDSGQDQATWEPLESLGELIVYERTDPEQVYERIGDASVVLTNKTQLNADLIRSAKQLKYIGVLATGTNVVDIQAAADADIVVCNVPGYSTDSVAQHVFALILEQMSRVAEHDAQVHQGRWANCDDFSFTTGQLTELAGKNLGIVGAGDIGQAVARIGYALGMNILVYSRTRKEIGVPAAWMELDELFKKADVLSLHCPLTPETQGLVSADRLSGMKRSAMLINTARGPLIDEAALANALETGKLAAAGLDVLSSEPPAPDNPLLTAPNCLITPHIAWASVAARQRLVKIAAENVAAFTAGKPKNVVSP